MGGAGGDTTAGIVIGTETRTGEGGAWACRSRAAAACRFFSSWGISRVWPAPRVTFVTGEVMWPRRSHCSMALRSYTMPSPSSVTGSLNNS